MNESIDAEYRETPGSAVALRSEDGAASPALFGTSDPIEIVQKAVRVADALKAVVVSKKLISNIQGKEYPQVEAWLTLAAMLRLTTICEWSRPVEDGWEARVIVRDAHGNTVGAAEAQCLKTERSKKSWEDYAIRSMAQTRSTSKALRSVLAFIMTLAGFQPTPAEEMPDPSSPSQPSPAPAGPTKREAEAARSNGGGACAECHAPAGKHATRCSRREAGDSSPQSAPAPAAVAEPTPEPERAPQPAETPATGISEGQRRLLFTRLKGTGFEENELARHAWYLAIGVPPSSSAWSASDFEHVLAKADGLDRR